MRSIHLFCLCFFTLFLLGCASEPKSIFRSPASTGTENGAEGRGGEVGSEGKTGKSGSINSNYLYQRLPLEKQYSVAIAGNDTVKMREWLDAGFSANRRGSPDFPSPIERAISGRSVEIVRMMAENPRAESRPNPRLTVPVCSGRKGKVELNIYEYIVYASALAGSKLHIDCDPERFAIEKAKDVKNLYIFEYTAEIFTLIANLDKDKNAFAAATKEILLALKSSVYTRQNLETNKQIIALIESKIPVQQSTKEQAALDEHLESSKAPEGSSAE